MAEKVKEVKFSYQVLNIKLISNNRSGTAAYKQIFQDLYTNTVIEKIGRGNKAFLRMLFPENIDGTDIFYGKISKFIDLDDNDDWVDIISKEKKKIEINPNLFPKLKETDFVFIPHAHRLTLRLSPDFSIKNAFDYFNVAIKRVIDADEDYSVIITQSQNVYDELFNADKVERLSIYLTYSNADDLGDDLSEWLDNQLRKSNSNSAVMEFETKDIKGLNLEVPLVEAALDNARENGNAEARIRDKKGRRVIKTVEHPEKVQTTADTEDNVKAVMTKEIISRYRNE
jgi:hypothetical protein